MGLIHGSPEDKKDKFIHGVTMVLIHGVSKWFISYKKSSVDVTNSLCCIYLTNSQGSSKRKAAPSTTYTVQRTCLNQRHTLKHTIPHLPHNILAISSSNKHNATSSPTHTPNTTKTVDEINRSVRNSIQTVSYTHLTLPTKRIV